MKDDPSMKFCRKPWTQSEMKHCSLQKIKPSCTSFPGVTGFLPLKKPENSWGKSRDLERTIRYVLKREKEILHQNTPNVEFWERLNPDISHQCLCLKYFTQIAIIEAFIGKSSELLWSILKLLYRVCTFILNASPLKDPSLFVSGILHLSAFPWILVWEFWVRVLHDYKCIYIGSKPNFA